LFATNAAQKTGFLPTNSNQKTAAQFRVRGVPSLLFFKNGQLIDHLNGAFPEQELAKLLEKFA
jgi:thioredoxin-like negative regulator of GroEL